MERLTHIGPFIRLLNKEFEQLHMEKANSLDLTPTQLFIVHYISLHQNENICNRDIEIRFDLSHATVSGIINRLESKGFIDCKADENDRRFKCIRVTQKAKCCEEEMKNHIDSYEKQLVKGFSEEEKEMFISFIHRMLDNLDIPIPKCIHKEDE